MKGRGLTGDHFCQYMVDPRAATAGNLHSSLHTTRAAVADSALQIEKPPKDYSLYLVDSVPHHSPECLVKLQRAD